MGHQPKPDATVKRTLLKAMEDKADGVRWQAALAFAKAGWSDADIVKALTACLNDKNEYVGAVAAKALVAVKAPDAGALLLQRLAGLPRTREEVDWTDRDNSLDIMDRMSSGGSTALMVLERETAVHNRPPKLEEALIEGIGELKYNPTADQLEKWLKGPLCAITIDALGKIDPAGQENRLMGLMSSEEGKIAVEALVKSRAWDLENLLVSTALNAKAHVKARSAALGYLRSSGSLGLPMRLVALLEDKTVISAGENRDSWRICDAAAQTIAGIEGWEDSKYVGQYSSLKERAGLLARARKWATTMPATMPS
jgi:HEAT repeat protein